MEDQEKLENYANSKSFTFEERVASFENIKDINESMYRAFTPAEKEKQEEPVVFVKPEFPQSIPLKELRDAFESKFTERSELENRKYLTDSTGGRYTEDELSQIFNALAIVTSKNVEQLYLTYVRGAKRNTPILDMMQAVLAFKDLIEEDLIKVERLKVGYKTNTAKEAISLMRGSEKR